MKKWLDLQLQVFVVMIAIAILAAIVVFAYWTRAFCGE
jgi:hypothetical protein